MSRIRDRAAQQDGAVFTILAIVLPLLLLLSAGGVTGVTLYTANRELQRAADQAALAGAAALPPFDPRVIAEHSPYPIPETDEVIAEHWPAGDPPRLGDPIVDPRSVACAYGSSALDPASAGVTQAFQNTELFETPLGEDGEELQTVCEDIRVYPTMQKGSSFDPVECSNRVVNHYAEEAGVDDILDPDALDILPSPIQTAVDSYVKMPLHRVLPAALSPRMHVDVYSYLRPPLLSFITGSDGGHMRASATAYRRIKNAVVVPILPIDQLGIHTGIKTVDRVVTDPVNLNRALKTPQADLINALDDADRRLDEVTAKYGEPCQHVLHNMRQDLRDVYDPPQGPAPSALDIVDAAVEATERTAARTGIPVTDPDNPESLAGEAFLLIGVSVDNFMQPVAATQIPILDVFLATMSEVSEGDYRAAIVNSANAYGLFRAVLVE
jgi:hypothetical protein